MRFAPVKGKVDPSPSTLLSQKTMLELKEVCFAYPHQERDGQLLFDGISLTVERGEYIAILGRDKAGKTTLAKLMKGLLHPSGGDILIDGQAIHRSEVGAHVGLILSTPDEQLLFPTVDEEISFGLECVGVERKVIRDRVEEYVGLLGMKKFRGSPLHFLSKSQQQRVAIMAVLALEPHYLIVDEAACLLDFHWEIRFMSVLSELNVRREMAVIHLTSSVEKASHSHGICVLENGKLGPKKTPAEIPSLRGSLVERGFSLPPVIELSILLKQMGYTVPQGLATLGEMEAFLMGAMRH